MQRELHVERLFEALVNGDRPQARQIVEEARRGADSFHDIVRGLFWPVHEMIDRMARSDQLSIVSHHFATRLLRVLVDQASTGTSATSQPGRSILAFCGPTDGEELGAQMAVDVLESEGFPVRFAGGGVPADEVVAQVHESRPDVLLMFSSAASDLPDIRRIVDKIRDIGACPNLQIVVGGGVFNRADGLAEEIGADLWATTPLELAERLIQEPERRATESQQTVGRKPRKRKAA